MPVMDFNGRQLEQNALPIASMIQGDGDQVGAILITIMNNGELNVSSVGLKQSQVRDSCLRKYDEVSNDFSVNE